MKAVVVGAGRIGCGFAAELLRSSGYDVVIAGRGPMIEHLAAAGSYVVRLVGGGKAEDHTVDGFEVVPTSDRRRLVGALAGADLVATAVGPRNLAQVAPFIADGLVLRDAPANVIAFENLADAGPVLRSQVASCLPPGHPLDHVGFSGAVVSRAVAHRVLPERLGLPPLFIGDPSCEFQVDRRALIGPIPSVNGMSAVDDYGAWVHRKLYTYGAGHAATAYLGHLKGYHYVHTAIRDPEIRSAVRAAMAEGQRGLAARYGSAIAGVPDDLDAIIARFDNAALGDRISRVGRDPRRKLGANDRLAGAARLAATTGAIPDQLVLAMAAAFCFSAPDDVQAVDFRAEVERVGVEAMLAKVCGLRPRTGLGRAVAARWCALAAGWSAGNLLLSLDRPYWAWSERGAA